MKNLFKFALGGVVMLVASMATAADDVTIQLKWVTQTQFAGYYVAPVSYTHLTLPTILLV